ncbi:MULTISPECIES: hypothetical protein [unclassified Raoultella]|uniref:hypothetical protein n=1 Tax=unclassified Raoultella TaxID=2627600 RepID=UPI0013581071|nr:MULTISPECIES: hypothetical protein [unclassified Raoultella]
MSVPQASSVVGSGAMARPGRKILRRAGRGENYQLSGLLSSGVYAVFFLCKIALKEDANGALVAPSEKK